MAFSCKNPYVTQFVLLALLTSCACQGADVTEQAPVEGVTGDPRVAAQSDNFVFNRPLEQSIVPLYQATNFFLESIMRPKSLAELNLSVDLKDWSAVQRSLQSDWQMWAEHYYQYVICWAIATVYVLILFIGGCVVCGCRSRGRCRGNLESRDAKPATRKRHACEFLLAVIAIGFLYGIVVIFISNNLMYEQTQATGVTSQLSSSLVSVDNFQQAALRTYDDYVNVVLRSELNSLSERVENFPSLAQVQLGADTGCEPLMTELVMHVGGLNATHDALAACDVTVREIQALSEDIQLHINGFSANVTAGFGSCTDADCAAALSWVTDLALLANFTGLPSTVPAVADLSPFLVGDNSVFINTAVSVSRYNGVQDIVRAVSQSFSTSLVRENEQIHSQAQVFLNTTSAFIERLTLRETQRLVNETVTQWVTSVGAYIYYGGLSLGSLLLLIEFLCVVGLLFGVGGGPADSNAHCCNRGNAGNFLRAALVLIYIFAAVVMAICSLLVAIGGIAHTDVCRHLVAMDDAEAVAVIDDVVTSYLNVSFSAVGFYESCGENKALYEALDIESFGPEYNITAFLDFSQYDIAGRIDGFRSATYTLPAITLLSGKLRGNLLGIESALRQVDLSRHAMELDKPAMNSSFSDVASLLQAVGGRHQGDPLASLFDLYASQADDLHRRFDPALNNLRSDLKDKVELVAEAIAAFNATTFVTQMTSSQTDLTSDALAMAVGTVADDTMGLYAALSSGARATVRSSLARCGAVHSVTRASLTAVCVEFLYPFNLFWFATGWCLAIFLLIAPISIALGDYYRQRGHSESADRSTRYARQESETSSANGHAGGMEAGRRDKGRMRSRNGAVERRDERELPEGAYGGYAQSIDGTSIDGYYQEGPHHYGAATRGRMNGAFEADTGLNGYRDDLGGYTDQRKNYQRAWNDEYARTRNQETPGMRSEVNTTDAHLYRW